MSSPLPENRTFGIELEVSCELYGSSSRQDISTAIHRRSGGLVHVAVVHASSDAHKQVIGGWKLVHDNNNNNNGSRIECGDRHDDVPNNNINCSKFRLVSPVLQGKDGLRDCHKMLELLLLRKSSTIRIAVNKRMGFHVHVGVNRGLTLQDLKKICMNFIRFEDVMDMFFPLSRRTTSADSDRHFRSCKAAIGNPDGTRAHTNRDRQNAIDACTTKEELCRLMNPNDSDNGKGRYYKLNLQNLMASGRQLPTVEFRQHPGTGSAAEVQAWIRFCVKFVHNSVRNPRSSQPKYSGGPTDPFLVLFHHLIEDPVLQRYFQSRVAKYANVGQESIPPRPRVRFRLPCCRGCASGGSCEAAGRS